MGSESVGSGGIGSSQYGPRIHLWPPRALVRPTSIRSHIIATGIAIAALAWYGMRSGLLWAWTTAVVAAVVGLGLALPMHYLDLFAHDWVSHLGPIYLATIVFVVGAGLAYRGVRSDPRPADTDERTGA